MGLYPCPDLKVATLEEVGGTMQTRETTTSIAADMQRIAADTQRLGFGETAKAMRHLAELYAELGDVRGPATAEALTGRA